jgi:hypothetical protein
MESGAILYSHAIGLRASVQANLDNFAILCKVGCIELVGLEIVVDQWLPRRRQTEDIEAIVVDEVLHLTCCHLRRWARVLQFEVIRGEVALLWCYSKGF